MGSLCDIKFKKKYEGSGVTVFAHVLFYVVEGSHLLHSSLLLGGDLLLLFLGGSGGDAEVRVVVGVVTHQVSLNVFVLGELLLLLPVFYFQQDSHELFHPRVADPVVEKGEGQGYSRQVVEYFGVFGALECAAVFKGDEHNEKGGDAEVDGELC